MLRIKKGILMNIVLLIITLLVLCVIFEVILRVFFPQDMNYFQLDKLLEYKGRANVKASFRTEDYNTTVILNSKGLRDYDYDYEKGNKKRILILGDSMTFGYGVENNETYVKFLENLLNLEGEEYEVINAGITGYNTDQELAFLETEGLKYSPDLVVLGFMTNDIYANSLSENIFALENNELIRKYPSYKFSLQKKGRNWLSANSHFYQFVKLKLGTAKRLTKEDKERRKILVNTIVGIDDSRNKGWEKTFLLIDRMKEDLDEHGIKLLIVILPNKHQVDDKQLKKLIEEYSIDEKRINITKSQDIVTYYLEKKGIEYIDLLDNFRKANKDNDFYYDYDTHFNVKGNKLAAELIYEKLIEEKLI